MRVLVVSDIHGNWEALRAVTEGEEFDRVLCLGDLVDYGPDPLEVVRWVRAHAALVVRGNHDNAVGFGVSCRSAPAFRRFAEESRRATLAMLGDDDLGWLRSLPLRAAVDLDGKQVGLVHAAPADPLFQYLPPSDRAGWADAMAQVDADLLLVGHTHLATIAEFGGRLLLNPGSVGLPRDGDPRASYAVLDQGRPELKRVAYDLERTVRDVWRWGLPEDCARGLERLYRGGEPAPIVSGSQA